MKKLRQHIRDLLLEYLHNDTVYLKQYFSTNDQQKINSLPHEYPHYFNDFVIEMDVDIDWDFPRNDVYNEDLPDYEKIEWLEKNHPDIIKQFGEYLFRKIGNHEMDIPDSEFPAWSYFDSDPEVIKNQWLIHFTNDANAIAREGFRYGVDDMTRLGLTTSLGEFDKKYGGYNFAYLLKDYNRYGISIGSYANRYKYGKEAVIFNASGIKLWHHGDSEPQVIFYGKTAKNIIPIITDSDTGDWACFSLRDGKKLYSNERLDRVVNWIVKNYRQYSKHLHII